MNDQEKNKWTVESIGVFHSDMRHRFETPRQGAFASNSGVIELFPGHNYETAAEDLAGFERIWVVFLFHLNRTWHPKVTPPVAPPDRKISVFATRSPHRPSRIGMSCVELESVKGRLIRVRNIDLLDQTPVLDVKPYIPHADSFPDSAAGWLDELTPENWTIEYLPVAKMQSIFISDAGGPDLINFCEVQLTHAPLDARRKRLTELGGECYEIGCRTWRICFRIDRGRRHICVETVRSNYSRQDLLPGAADKYGDLDIHRRFLLEFPDGEALSQDEGGFSEKFPE